MGQILAERLTGRPTVTGATAVMRWGLDCEPLARAAYAYHTDLDVELTSFVAHPRHRHERRKPRTGWSALTG